MEAFYEFSLQRITSKSSYEESFNKGKCRRTKHQAQQEALDRKALQTKDFVYNERKSHCMRKIQGKDLCQKADIEQE